MVLITLNTVQLTSVQFQFSLVLVRDFLLSPFEFKL